MYLWYRLPDAKFDFSAPAFGIRKTKPFRKQNLLELPLRRDELPLPARPAPRSANLMRLRAMPLP